MENDVFEFRITYDEPLTLETLARFLEFVNGTFDSALAICSIRRPELREDLARSTVRVKGVREGSILLDLLIPALVSIGVNVISGVIIEIFRKAFEKVRANEKPSLSGTKTGVVAHVPSAFKTPSKSGWTDEEERLVARKAVDIYVINKKNLSSDGFIMDPDFGDIIIAHGAKSLLLKLRNIRYLLDRELTQGRHTLDVPPLSHYSKKNERAVEQCLNCARQRGSI